MRLEVELRIWGDTGAIGLATIGFGVGWSQGDQRRAARRVQEKQSAWRLRSRLDTHSLEEHVDGILALVRDEWSTITTAAATGETELSVALYVYPRVQPVLGLRADQLQALAQPGASLDLDMLLFDPT